MSGNSAPKPMFPFPLAQARLLSLAEADVDVVRYEAFVVFLAGQRGDAPALIGGYGERRAVYSGSLLFDDDDEPRDIHLGIDVWTEAGTPVAAPVAGTVHSFGVNDAMGDYGAAIILEHDGFFTLYGHLAHRSLNGLHAGKPVAAGEVFAWLGDRRENGGWPPHLHFQKVTDLLGHEGDFPGVARASERERWLTLCPDPSDLMI